MCSSETKDSLNQFVIGSKGPFGQNAIVNREEKVVLYFSKTTTFRLFYINLKKKGNASI